MASFVCGRVVQGELPLKLIVVCGLAMFLFSITMLPKPLHTYVIDDHTFVAIMLLLGSIVVSAVAVVFFSVKIQQEFAGATYSVAHWLDQIVQQEEISGVNITEQLIQGQKLVLTQVQQYQDSLNGTKWGPALRSVYLQLELSSNRTGSNLELAQGWVNDVATSTSHWDLRQISTAVWQEVAESEHLKTALKDAGVGLAETLLSSAAMLLSWIGLFAGIGTQAVIFCTVLFYALCNPASPITEMSNFLPVPESRRARLLVQVESSIEKVLFLPVVVALLNSVIGLAGFLVARLCGNDIEFMYFGTFLIFWSSVCPLVQPYLVPLPWAAALALNQCYMSAAMLFIGIYLGITMSNGWAVSYTHLTLPTKRIV
eukprot:TRINITY_DN29455_c0_g1_i2.p1 TRINITY_DN29455_c0_g1~~TRINITY_DN29455_c0_g1_i2.p1  ORF type:complete len:371 (+),score=105.15 TRINITY_DN29455_c0_g1_i2:512-1624(+)